MTGPGPSGPDLTNYTVSKLLLHRIGAQSWPKASNWVSSRLQRARASVWVISGWYKEDRDGTIIGPGCFDLSKNPTRNSVQQDVRYIWEIPIDGLRGGYVAHLRRPQPGPTAGPLGPTDLFKPATSPRTDAVESTWTHWAKWARQGRKISDEVASPSQNAAGPEVAQGIKYSNY